MMKSWDALFKFSKFWFSGLLEGKKGKKMAQNDKTFCLPLDLRNHTPYDCGFWYTCKMMIYQTIIFSFFQNSDILIFRIFQSSINAKRKFWGVPHLLHMGVIFSFCIFLYRCLLFFCCVCMFLVCLISSGLIGFYLTESNDSTVSLFGT